MKILVMGSTIKTESYSQNNLKNKFLASFISSFQRDSKTRKLFFFQNLRMIKRMINASYPCPRETSTSDNTNKVSRPTTRPSSFPKPVGHRLKGLNSLFNPFPNGKF